MVTVTVTMLLKLVYIDKSQEYVASYLSYAYYCTSSSLCLYKCVCI